MIIDVLSYRYALISMMIAKLQGCECINDLYSIDPNLGNVFRACKQFEFSKF